MVYNPLISIIIPTYNVESYIGRCLDSCINQTLDNIEIIVVDDCGNDDSIKIAKEYAKKDFRIRILHNEKNLGTFHARANGIIHAIGEYCMFADPDDYLDIKACEKSYQAILESLKKQDVKNAQNLNLKDLHSQDSHNQTIDFPKHLALQSLQTLLQENLESLPDIIHFKFHYTANKQANPLTKLIHYTRYIFPTRFCKQPLYNEQIANNFFLSSTEFPKFTLCDKCYKTSLIKKVVPFVEKLMPLKLIMAEDMLKFFVISAFAKSYVSVNSRLYFYCLNHSSITQNPQAKQKKIADMCHISEALHSLGKELKIYNPLMPFIAQVMSKNLAALIILESRFLENRGGGRFYTCTTPIPYRICPYSIAKDSTIYSLYPLALCALLFAFLAILESLSYLYSLNRICPKLYSYQTLTRSYLSLSRHIYVA